MMTWQPIGPEQMDGRVYLVGWDDEPMALAYGFYPDDEWLDARTGSAFAISPTHYLPGVRPLGEAEAPRDARTVRVRAVAALGASGEFVVEGGSHWDDADMLRNTAGLAASCGVVMPVFSFITADLPIPEVREIAANVGAVE